MQMTNREKLIQTNIYDLLCSIQNSLSGSGAELSGLCIIEDITKKGKPCPEEVWFGSRCSECIAKWLDEEA